MLTAAEHQLPQGYFDLLHRQPQSAHTDTGPYLHIESIGQTAALVGDAFIRTVLHQHGVTPGGLILTSELNTAPLASLFDSVGATFAVPRINFKHAGAARDKLLSMPLYLPCLFDLSRSSKLPSSAIVLVLLSLDSPSQAVETLSQTFREAAENAQSVYVVLCYSEEALGSLEPAAVCSLLAQVIRQSACIFFCSMDQPSDQQQGSQLLQSIADRLGLPELSSLDGLIRKPYRGCLYNNLVK